MKDIFDFIICVDSSIGIIGEFKIYNFRNLKFAILKFGFSKIEICDFEIWIFQN